MHWIFYDNTEKNINIFKIINMLMDLRYHTQVFFFIDWVSDHSLEKDTIPLEKDNYHAKFQTYKNLELAHSNVSLNFCRVT